MTDSKDFPAAVVRHGQTHDEWAKSEDRVPVFAISQPDPDGQTFEENGVMVHPEPIVTEYTMPRKPNSGIALKYLKLARQVDPSVAMSWLIEAAVGEAGYDALSEEPDMDSAQLRAIVEKVQKIAMGGLDPKAG